MPDKVFKCQAVSDGATFGPMVHCNDIAMPSVSLPLRYGHHVPSRLVIFYPSSSRMLAASQNTLVLGYIFIYYMTTRLNEDYKEIIFESAACLAARRLSRIFDKALLVLIGRLAAEEVGNTWLVHSNESRRKGELEEWEQYRFHHVSSSSISLDSSGSSKRSRRLW